MVSDGPRLVCWEGMLLDANGRKTAVPCPQCKDAGIEERRERMHWDARSWKEKQKKTV